MSTYPAQNNANSECNSLYSSQHCQYTTTIGPSSRKPCDKIACPGLGREVKAIIQTQIFRIKCFVIHSVAVLYTGEWKSYQCRNLTIPWSSKLMLTHYPVLKTLQWEKHAGFQNSDLWGTFREGEHPGACLVCLCLSYMRALSLMHPVRTPRGYFFFYGSAVRKLTHDARNFSSLHSSWENSTAHSFWLVEELAPKKEWFNDGSKAKTTHARSSISLWPTVICREGKEINFLLY